MREGESQERASSRAGDGNTPGEIDECVVGRASVARLSCDGGVGGRNGGGEEERRGIKLPW